VVFFLLSGSFREGSDFALCEKKLLPTRTMQREMLPTLNWLVSLETKVAPLKPDMEEPGRRCRRYLHIPARRAATAAEAEGSSDCTAGMVPAGSNQNDQSGCAGQRRLFKQSQHRAAPYTVRMVRRGSASSSSHAAENTEALHGAGKRQDRGGSAAFHTGAPSVFHRMPQYWSVVDHDHTDDGEQLDASRPAFSFSCLIGLAILSAEFHRLPIAHIYEYIQRNFPYFQTAAPSWKNSVRHVLSLDKFFHKPPRGGVKGTEWEVKPLMLGYLVGLIAEGQTRLPPATARHLGLPELRASSEIAAAPPARGMKQSPSPSPPTPASTSASRPRRATGKAGGRKGKSKSRTGRKKATPPPHQIPTATVVAAAAAACPFPFPIKVELDDLDDLDGLKDFEASGYSSSGSSSMLTDSYDADSSAFSIHDAPVKDEYQHVPEQLLQKRLSITGDRRFSTSDWSVLPSDDAIIATVFGPQSLSAALVF